MVLCFLLILISFELTKGNHWTGYDNGLQKGIVHYSSPHPEVSYNAAEMSQKQNIQDVSLIGIERLTKQNLKSIYSEKIVYKLLKGMLGSGARNMWS